MPGPKSGRGTLVLVVGPSGAGKDTLIDGARRRLAGDNRFVFPHRFITRPSEAGGEEHIFLEPKAFVAKRAAGGFALTWEAHGLAYGIPAEIEDELARGRHVVVNVSRDVVAQAAGRFDPLAVILVTAPPATLARRLTARGRETATAIEERLSGVQTSEAVRARALTVINDGTIEEGITDFLSALERLTSNAQGELD